MVGTKVHGRSDVDKQTPCLLLPDVSALGTECIHALLRKANQSTKGL